MSRRLRIYIGYLMLTVFAWYYSGITLFPHTHVYSWGSVTHSHPYLPSAHHTHTSASLQFVAQADAGVFTAASSAICLLSPKAEITIRDSVVACRCDSDVSVPHLRAPPSVC